ncbi:MAG TPA: hypothetical protein DDW62_10240 [Marinilabiliaceae bacterium]|nr:hypothetical protein [Marinilabiliaceae bacterium]
MIQRRIYIKPKIEEIVLDVSISMQMVTENNPPGGGGGFDNNNNSEAAGATEEVLKSSGFNEDPFK